MKSFLTLFTILIIFSACMAKAHENNTTIPWEQNLSIAFEKAKNEDKIVMVMASSQGCRWCEKLERNTLNDTRILLELKKFILVKANRETPNERSQLPKFTHVPVVFFMSAEKEEIESILGYFEADDFLEYLQEFDED